MCTACLCRSACLTSGRRMSGARLRARRPRLARRLAAAVHGALLVSVGAVLRLGGRVRELPRPRSVNCLPGGLPRARAELRVRRVHRGRGASGARRRAQGAEQREHLRVGVRPGVLPCRMGLRQLQHAGAGVSARPRWQACSKRADAGCTPCPDLRLAKGSYHRRPTSSGQRETSARPNAVLACTTTRHSSPRAAAGTAGTARSWRCTRASSSSSSLSLPATRRAMRAGHRARRSRAHTSLEQCAFEWQPESCAINCLPPWLSTRARSSTAEDTCVLCDAEHGKREEQNTWSRTF